MGGSGRAYLMERASAAARKLAKVTAYASNQAGEQTRSNRNRRGGLDNGEISLLIYTSLVYGRSSALKAH
jgi:hypothetical protein